MASGSNGFDVPGGGLFASRCFEKSAWPVVFCRFASLFGGVGGADLPPALRSSV